jgi:hypothetical protein
MSEATLYNNTSLDLDTPLVPACCCSYRSNNEELFSFSVSDNLIAAGGQGNVLFWDRRTQQQLATFDDMHMDDVTQVG